MYIEYFTYTTQKNLQGPVSDWQGLQLEFNGENVRFVLHNNIDESDLYEDNIDKKHIAVEIKREDAIEIARGILFALNAL